METTNDKNFVSDHLDDRRQAETVLNRADHLDPSDRAILNQVLGQDVKPSEIAAICGVTTRSVQRRVQRLTDRLLDPKVVFVLRNSRYWSKPLATTSEAAARRIFSRVRCARSSRPSMPSSSGGEPPVFREAAIRRRLRAAQPTAKSNNRQRRQSDRGVTGSARSGWCFRRSRTVAGGVPEWPRDDRRSPGSEQAYGARHAEQSATDCHLDPRRPGALSGCLLEPFPRDVFCW